MPVDYSHCGINTAVQFLSILCLIDKVKVDFALQ